MSQQTGDAILAAARTVYGESRSEPYAGQLAVAWVIRNRAAEPGWWGGPDWLSVCRKPWQFSCWNANDPNRVRIEGLTAAQFLDEPTRQACLRAVLTAAAGDTPDPSRGATHYVRTDWLADPHLRPAWSLGQTPVCRIGAHSFFRLPS